MKHHPLKFFKDYKIEPRGQQTQVLDDVMANWDAYDYFALSLPTGVGKTFIATSIADAAGTAYIVTSTLQLQAQYEKSWDKIISLKGRSNYTCNLNENFTVDAAPCSANTQLISLCIQQSICAYYNQKDLALKAKAMITNPVYLLYSTHCGFAKDEESPWVRRNVMIIDEAHNLENHLVSFAESDVDPQRYSEDFGVDTHSIQFTGRPEEDYMKVIDIRDILLTKADELKAEMDRAFIQGHLIGMDNPKDWARSFTGKQAEKVKKLGLKANALDKAIQPLKIFFNTHNTPEELMRRWIVSKYPDRNVLKLAPIYGDFLFKEYFKGMANKFVFLSATLGTKKEFCKEIGVEHDKCLFVETDSPFDPVKSPIIVMPSIKLSKEYYDQNIIKIGGIMDDILKLHPNQRGLIHCVTYDLQKQIFNRVNKTNQKRLLCRDMDTLRGVISDSKYPKKYRNEELLSLHDTTGKSLGSVLLSPSMMEGIDLHDDLSEFQVLIKLPWANLGDVRVKVKSNLDGEWYANKMWLNVLQASGRSTRHEEDTSITYILDEKFVYFYNQWKHKLPNWFKHRLVF